MQNSGTSTSAADAVAQMGTITTTTLILIALAVVATLLMLWWGARLRRARRDAIETLEEEGRVERVDDAPAPTEDAVPQVATQDPGAVALASAPGLEAVPVVAPTAPSPPPIADSPVIATAPDAVVTPPTGAGSSDDLTTLKGVGPKVAAELAQRGITSFAALAALSPSDAEALDAELGNFRGRMFRDRWIDQARHLAAGDRAGFEAEFGKL